MWRSAYFSQDFHTLDNFLLVHSRYGDPLAAVDHTSVTLHGADASHVWFCAADDDVYDVAAFPFAWHAQNVGAKKIIKMRHEVFFRMVKATK